MPVTNPIAQLHEVLERVYALPSVLHGQLALGRRVSLVGLVVATGYPAVRDQVTVSMLHAGLQERREIVSGWLRYAAEKDVLWGWFFEVDSRGRYSVGLKSGLADQTRCEIADSSEACALFIKQELEAIMGAPDAASSAR